MDLLGIIQSWILAGQLFFAEDETSSKLSRVCNTRLNKAKRITITANFYWARMIEFNTTYCRTWVKRHRIKGLLLISGRLSKFRNFFLSSILIFTSLCTTFIKRSWSPLTESQWLLCIVFHLYCFPLVLNGHLKRKHQKKTNNNLSSQIFHFYFFASRLASGQPVLSSHPANPHG